MLKTGLLVIAALLACLALYVRLSPVDVRAFHVDPETAERPAGAGSYVLRAKDGDASPFQSSLTPGALAARLEAIILATPRTERLSGKLEDGFASYVTRSALWGFPDIATVKIKETSAGSEIILISRLRFGSYDLGVNRARVEAWLAQL